MLVPFDKMPDQARVWVYQANRSLSPNEVAFVEQASQNFLNQWQAHGQDLKASFKVAYDQFLILTVDESFSQASGCSIDASVHLIKALEQKLGISFMTNGQVAFLKDERISLYPFNQLKKAVEDNEVSPETLIFDNTIQTLADLNSKWLTESSNTWVSRYFS